jgi:hypothetical protein
LAGQLLVAAIVPLGDEETNDWYYRLLSHIVSLPIAVQQADVSHASAFSMVYKSLGSWKAYKELQIYCYSTLDRVSGAQNPETMQAMSRLAEALCLCGELKEAEKIERDVLELRIEMDGPRGLHTITEMSNLARLLHDLGDLKEAGKMHRDVLELRTEILRPRHPDTVTAMNEVSTVLRDLGELKEAEKMQRDALELRTKILGPRHLDTLDTMSNLDITL